ncbi:Alpha-1-3-glucanase/mutanase [Penicillium manginii]|uniref:Alpha-1-3-glucanase/mutanase n=1 Tax=Penicillium manginii TaxID=203109 RepID=UPI0025477B41|nr:Alpha-1-3-glucanase/mutanase [Penicillium manginii]KAJ5750450.1 Alpha-1-3-glucanase/mutanase [Penicillium manginii]
MLQRLVSLLLLALMASLAMTSPVGTGSTSSSSAIASLSASGGEKLVFCHFMVGICGNRKSADDYDADMKRAKESGIDAFALNIGTDPYTDEQLRFAYLSAARNGMKVFLSFDFNWWAPSNGAGVGAKVGEYAGLEAQLKVDNKVFVSSFAGDGIDVQAVVAAAGRDIFFAPNFHPGQGNFGSIQGALNWMAWPSNGNNKAPTPGHNVTVAAGDEAYINALGGKPYIAPVSPWFSTHYGSEVSYSKNWVFPSDLLWYERWQEILNLSPRFVEIVTWNDYGESHYVGPLSSPHGDDGNSKWAMDMPHNGWLDMAKPFIAAFKAGCTSPNDFVQEDQLVYWYRPTKRDVNCDATDTTMGGANNASGNFFMGRPNGWESMKDEVFVVSLFKSAAQVHVQSGDQSQTFQAPAGISAHSVPMGVGKQKFAVTRDGNTVLSGTSLKDVSDTCICGIYNFNAYVGTLPAPATIDRLQPDALAMLSKGLKVACPMNTLNVALATSTCT